MRLCLTRGPNQRTPWPPTARADSSSVRVNGPVDSSKSEKYDASRASAFVLATSSARSDARIFATKAVHAVFQAFRRHERFQLGERLVGDRYNAVKVRRCVGRVCREVGRAGWPFYATSAVARAQIELAFASSPDRDRPAPLEHPAKPRPTALSSAAARREIPRTSTSP